ncbi:hypothetical protein KSP40_PGU014142 [Platanthera guangdongensis]|uniref:Uncharacterized protein n=1 Tax=Platanthera guangdongensis TaxID=2320717 RepID=A0ABR2LCF3_9ASPA
MADVISPNPKPIYTPPAPPPSASTVIHDHLESTTGSDRLRPIRRPALRFTSEFDSEGPFFLHKLSCEFFDNLAKFKFSFQNNINGVFFRPQLGFLTKNLSVLYDFESRNSHLRGSLQLGKNMHVRSAYNLQGSLNCWSQLTEVRTENLCNRFKKLGLGADPTIKVSSGTAPAWKKPVAFVRKKGKNATEEIQKNAPSSCDQRASKNLAGNKPRNNNKPSPVIPNQTQKGILGKPPVIRYNTKFPFENYI